VDKAHDAVLVPLFGALVPFHVSTIKSVTKTEEGHKTFLRLNFYAPGTAPGKECGPSMLAALRRHPQAIFVRTLSFMSRDGRNMGHIAQTIKAMQKKLKTERDEAATRAGLVEQQKLVLARDRFPRLTDLNMWPAISGRKTQGGLEAHTNGLRFVSNKGERIEILYANIRHGIFQPCEKEHVVLIHFHLKHAILIGKKKYKDVQFFTEVIESSQAIDGRARRDYDADELGEEERERRMRQEMNKAFKKFAERVEEVAEKDPTSPFSRFDVPQRDLAFSCVREGGQGTRCSAQRLHRFVPTLSPPPPPLHPPPSVTSPYPAAAHRSGRWSRCCRASSASCRSLTSRRSWPL